MIEMTIKKIDKLIELIKEWEECNLFNDGIDYDIIEYLEEIKKPLVTLLKGAKK